MENKKLKLGDNVKITGGKYKKLGQGVLKTLKPTYCDVEFDVNNMLVVHKVKIDYIFPVDNLVIDMPEADQLQNVEQDPDEFIAQNPDMMKVEVEEVEEPIHPDDEEFDNLEDQITQLEKKAQHYLEEASVYMAERDQADAKVMEQDELIKKLTNRNAYLEELCRKILLP